MLPRLRKLTLAVAGVLLLGGCGEYGDFRFTQDHRLTFDNPHHREVTELPVRLSWTMEDFTILEAGATGPLDDDHGLFAVFLDRSPIRPRRTLADVFDNGQPCSPETCGNRALLAEQGVYVTRKPRLVLRDVPRTGSRQDTQLHQATVILLDASGRRIGESAWYDAFRIEHPDLDE